MSEIQIWLPRKWTRKIDAFFVVLLISQLLLTEVLFFFLHRTVQMRLYTLTKRQFVLVFVSFFVAFFLTIIIGIAGVSPLVKLI